MSGLDILSAVSAASTLLESAIGIIRRIRRAQAQQKELAGILRGHSDEVGKTKAILTLIEDEDVLRTAKVASEVSHITSVTEELVTFLESVDPGSQTIARQVAHQMARGSKDEKMLIDIMQKLDRARSNLSLRIQVALVGVAKTVEDKLIANTEVVERIDANVKEVFGDGRGLKLAELIKNKQIQNDGMVTLSDDDLKELGAEVVGKDVALAIPTSRIVIENTVEDQALQINGPIGMEGWWEASNLEIRQNRAKGKTIQINHGISEDTFDKLLRNRVANMEQAIRRV